MTDAGDAPRPPADGESTHFFRAGRKISLRRVPEGTSARGGTAGVPAYVPEDGDPECLLVPTGQVVVQFTPEVDEERASAEIAARDASIVRRIGYLPNGYVIETAPARSLHLANELHGLPFVAAAEPNWLRRTRKR